MLLSWNIWIKLYLGRLRKHDRGLQACWTPFMFLAAVKIYLVVCDIYVYTTIWYQICVSNRLFLTNFKEYLALNLSFNGVTKQKVDNTNETLREVCILYLCFLMNLCIIKMADGCWFLLILKLNHSKCYLKVKCTSIYKSYM